MRAAWSFDYLQTHLRTLLTTSPKVSSTAAQTNAELKFAVWNCHDGIRKMPATSGTEARSGPKKRPMKIASTPQRLTKASPRGSSSGWRDSGHTCATGGPSLMPTQNESQSPSAAPIAPATQIGQKLRLPELISTPMPTSAAQAGISSEMKASDSPNASANTIGAAHTSCVRTNSTICWAQASREASIGGMGGV